MQTVSIAEQFYSAKVAATDPEEVLSLIIIFLVADLNVTDYNYLWSSLKSYTKKLTSTLTHTPDPHCLNFTCRPS